MDTQELLGIARKQLTELTGECFDILTISKPKSVDEACNLAKIISKLSPLMGNLIEFKITEFLNEKSICKNIGTWHRQDPGFPDVIFKGDISPVPGFEIKAWFPFATEITGRFKDSEERFVNDEIDLVILAWLPEYIFWGKPKIIDVCVVSGKSVAEARDKHYHSPPRYLVLEPEETGDRTSNLQQTNTNGYVIQEKSSLKLTWAAEVIKSWGSDGLKYSTSRSYQNKLKELMGKVQYRLDTNYAKIDRIEHAGIEKFKARVLNTHIGGYTISKWSNMINNLPEHIAKALINN